MREQGRGDDDKARRENANKTRKGQDGRGGERQGAERGHGTAREGAREEVALDCIGLRTAHMKLGGGSLGGTATCGANFQKHPHKGLRCAQGRRDVPKGRPKPNLSPEARGNMQCH